MIKILERILTNLNEDRSSFRRKKKSFTFHPAYVQTHRKIYAPWPRIHNTISINKNLSLSSCNHFFSVQAVGASLKPPYHPGCEVHINPAPFPSLSLSLPSFLRPEALDALAHAHKSRQLQPTLFRKDIARGVARDLFK